MALFFRRKKKAPPTPTSSDHQQLDFRAIAVTDVGAVRDNNEDNLVFIRPHNAEKRNTKGCLAVVADGMGGHSSGEVASQTAIEIIPRVYYDSQKEVLEALNLAFTKTNKAIYQRAQKNPSLAGMGTTCTAVVLLDQRIFLAHVGDSRAYLLKNGKLVQLSSDHTYVQHLLDQKLITAEEALSHPKRNVITRAMGTRPQVTVDCKQVVFPFEMNDKMLLCSDGLYEYFSVQELEKLLKELSLQQASKEFIRMAKHRGGHDNISALLIEAHQAAPKQEIKETQNLTNPS